LGNSRRVCAVALVAVLGTATAFVHADVTTLATRAAATNEPVVLLLSGSALLMVASALRRLPL
jgi:hypothetical protein